MPALRTVPILSQQVIESEQLKIVRRHFAASRRVLPHANIGDKDEQLAGRPDETAVASSYLRAVPDTLASFWGDKSADISRCYAVSDWIWFNLRLGQVTHPQNWDEIEKGQNFFEAMEVGQCLIGATEIGWTKPSQLAESREHYLNWLWQRAIEPKLLIDDKFLERVVDHLETFYSGLLREYRKQFRGHELNLLEATLSRRFGFLPDPIEQLMARRSAFSRFYTARHAVTVGKHQFEPIRFWKKARAALIYGKSRTRTNDGKIARLERVDDGLILRKPIYAKLTDELFPVLAARGEAAQVAFDEFAHELELPEPMRSECGSRALNALEPHVLANVLNEATEASLTHRYAKVEEKLRLNKPVGLHEFVPNSLEALEHYLGLKPGTESFDAKKAFNGLAERVGQAEAAARLAGIPVKLVGSLVVEDDVLADLISQPLGPISWIQITALRRNSGGAFNDDAEVQSLIDRLDEYGELFISILKWVWRWSFREDDWRMISHSRRTILVWAHADRLTRMFRRAGSDVVSVEKHFGENHLQLQPNDFFVGNRAIPIDLASPRSISSAVLLFHGLAAIFGDEDVREYVSEDRIASLKERLTMQVGEVVSPTFELMMRMGGRTENSLGGFLDQTPNGVLPDNLDPKKTIESVVEGALDHLEETPDSADAWVQLAGFCPSGLSDAQWERANSLIAQTGLWNLPFIAEKMQFTVWRALLSPLFVRDWEKAIDELVRLARHCRVRYGGRINPQGDQTAKQGFAAVAELIETAALIASEGGVDSFDERFKQTVWSVVSVWPEAAASLRPMINELNLQTMTRRAASIDELRTFLSTFP